MIYRISYTLTKEVNEWKLMSEDAQRILNDMKRYNSDLQSLRTVTENARIKTITFYQISKTPELVQNYIWWAVWVMNMRFLNRASRKAGDYWFKIADAYLKKDRPAMTKIFTQIAVEWMYSSKIYMYMNNASDGWVNYNAFMGSLFLPYVVMNMSLLNVPDAILKISWIDESERNQPIWIRVANSFGNIFAWFGEKAKARILSAPIFWVSQFVKMYNWRVWVDEKETTNDLYSTVFWGIPIVWSIMEILADIAQQRIWRFNTDTTTWIYRNYLSSSNKNYFLNAITNQKITNDIIWESNQKNAFYKMIEAGSDWISLSIELLWFQTNNRMKVKAFTNFYKKRWLEQFNWWPFVMDVLDKLELQIDDGAIEKTLLAEGQDYSYIKILQDENTLNTWADEWATL